MIRRPNFAAALAPTLLLAATVATSQGAAMPQTSQPLAVRKMTPILQVERIEPSLPFWKSLGFSVAVEVPHEDRLGFVILVRDDLELMMQTVESMRADIASIAPERATPTLLFVEVENLDAVRAALVEAEVLVGPRETAYGMREIFVREPGGNVIGLAQPIGER